MLALTYKTKDVTCERTPLNIPAANGVGPVRKIQTAIREKPRQWPKNEVAVFSLKS